MKNLASRIDAAGLAIKPGDVFRISTAGRAVTLIPERAKTGFIRKGKALISTVPGEPVMTVERVNQELEASRQESVQQSVELATGSRRK